MKRKGVRVRLVVVTGLSGSGKTAALKALEDLNFYCVDNLPAPLLPKFLELSVFAGGEIRKVALGMDLREKHFLESYREAFDQAEKLGIKAEVLFLEASDQVLLRRFSETRRRHPLAKNGPILDGIRKERELCADLKTIAGCVLDTSEMSVHDLKKITWEHFKQGPEDQTLQVNVESFGYRHGIPHEADLLIDVRFLPNPYFVPDLKNGTGVEAKIQDFVLKSPEAKEFLRLFSDLIRFLLPLYENEGKTSLTIAVGCTGGKHRSVSVVEEIRRRLEKTSRIVRVFHRDVDK